MIESFSSVGLPVCESLSIKKNRIEPEQGSINAGRIAIVTGTHGDELEGQYVCYELQRRINEHPEFLLGTVDVYPALNPLGVDSIERGIPHFDLDMNRIFPGSLDSTSPEFIARGVVDDLSGADLVIDIHASNIFLRELPQIRVAETSAEKLLPLALKCNIDYIWMHASSTVLESTLAHSLNSTGTPTLVVEMGVGMRITRNYGEQLVDGIIAVMCHLGLWGGPRPQTLSPIVSTDGAVSFINAAKPGIFLPAREHTDYLKKGDLVGTVLDPLSGTIAEEVYSPTDGLLFTLREYPVVYPGSLIARILGGEF